MPLKNRTRVRTDTIRKRNGTTPCTAIPPRTVLCRKSYEQAVFSYNQ